MGTEPSPRGSAGAVSPGQRALGGDTEVPQLNAHGVPHNAIPFQRGSRQMAGRREQAPGQMAGSRERRPGPAADGPTGSRAWAEQGRLQATALTPGWVSTLMTRAQEGPGQGPLKGVSPVQHWPVSMPLKAAGNGHPPTPLCAQGQNCL